MKLAYRKAIVTVIIPVYKTEKYIRECLDSVLKQSISKKYKNNYIEIICIDDGSPDNSKSIISEYIEKHNNIILLEQVNSGQSIARNNAITIAKGKYIIFLDSDDLLPEDAISSLLDVADETQSEVIVSHSKAFNIRRSWYIAEHAEVACASLRKVKFFHRSILVNTPPPWGKLYSRDLIIRNGIKFPVGIKLAEDWIFVMNAMYKANHISSTPAVTYLYRGRDDEDNPSCTQIVNEKVFLDLIAVYNLTLQFNLPPRQTWLAKLFILRGILYRLDKFSKDNDFNSCKSTYKTLHQFLKNDIGVEALEVFTPKRRLPLLLLFNGFYSETHRVLNGKFRREFFKREDIKHSELIKDDFDFFKQKRNILTQALVKVKKYKRKIKKSRWGFQYYSAALIAKYFYRHRNISLIGERLGNTANDSSYHLFRYANSISCHSKKVSDAEYYYVIKKESMTRSNLSNYKNVVSYGSLKHFIIFHASQRYIFSDCMRDVFFRWKEIAHHHEHKPLYFLQHGIFALNRAAGYYDRNSMDKRKELPNKFIVSSEHERNLVCKNFGFFKDEVAVTGLSRFDHLPKKMRSPSKKILIMFTWRDSLNNVPVEQFKESQYYKRLVQVLTDKNISELLHKYGYTIEACLHHKLHQYTDDIRDSNSCNIHSMNEVDVQSLIIESDFMITDYSSASFDMLYQRKPVLFYWFDEAQFFAQRGGPLINPLKDVPGMVSRDIESLTRNIELMIKNKCTLDTMSDKKSKIFFKYRDNSNCRRILSLIES
ncbi:bifunctional glycosyltransferase family 2 protein/CDP-glycerol:glycerophosphate glycerophosphotransferase [Yersinia massiliensis]|uniref:Glycosyltransferase n=1 Tax=Yersinia massiliensis TaxID=419257 RepID=A0AA90XUV4_9GAMM|nr:glycosyltransferase [Yersinia massiliensis]MDA5546187.1 CDP-glycerol glycerophosphotransferase family protein [Yersinia massiliensis]NIL27343.1 glycosyltransferase [Yersinia massiliensis]UZM80317.1 bifunctional glycosyltransferase family 2 protein/CDP-glycerol:glycerophosphate glycerophosphotransferase [Yersinia massiliensis]